MDARPCLLGVAQGPGFQQRLMFASGALYAPFWPQVRLDVALRQGVKATQNLGSHGLQARHDE